MKKTINRITFKVGDSFYIDTKYSLGERVKIMLDGEVVKTSVGDNQDGTVDLTVYFKAIDYEFIPIEE